MKNKQIRIAAWKMYICNPNPNPDPNTKIQFVLDKNICLALQRVKSRLFWALRFCFRVLEHFYSECVVSGICCLVCGFCGRHLYHIFLCFFFFFFYTFGPGSTILFFSCLRPGCDVCVKLAGNALAAIQRFNSCMLIFMFWFQTTPPLKY